MKLASAVAIASLVAPGCVHGPPQEHSEHSEHHGHHGGMPHRFEDAERWAKVFEDPARDAWQRPAEVIAALKLPADARVADIGAATGYFSVRLARAVPSGRVYGVDIEPDMVHYLGERARREGISNLQAVLGAPDDPKLPDAVDLVLVVDTYHHIERRSEYFERVASRLRPGGRIAIVDFRKGQPMGPPEEARVEPSQVTAELQAAGYRLVEELGFLPNQYFLVYGR